MREGKVLVEIPLALIITKEVVKESDLYKQLMGTRVKKLLSSPPHTAMALFLLSERENPASKYKAFIDALPSNFTTFPYFYNDYEMELLQGSSLVELIILEREFIHQEYKAIAAEIPFLRNYLLKDWEWANFVVQSRSFKFEVCRSLLILFFNVGLGLSCKETKKNCSCAQSLLPSPLVNLLRSSPTERASKRRSVWCLSLTCSTTGDPPP